MARGRADLWRRPRRQQEQHRRPRGRAGAWASFGEASGLIARFDDCDAARAASDGAVDMAPRLELKPGRFEGAEHLATGATNVNATLLLQRSAADHQAKHRVAKSTGDHS